MFELRRLHRELRRIEAECNKQENVLMKNGAKSEDIERLRSGYVPDIFEIQEQIQHNVTRGLTRAASRHLLPVPPYGTKPFWEAGCYTGGYYLTTDGIKEVRKEIHELYKARCEILVPITTIITAFTGFVGAIIGVLALLR